MQSAQTPDEAVRLMLTEAQQHNFDAAYSRLANRAEVDKAAFVRDLYGSNGSLLTYASRIFDVWGLMPTIRTPPFEPSFITPPRSGRWMIFAI